MGALGHRKADLNLGLHTFVGSTPIDQAVIDTSTTSIDTIQYFATDSAGISATSTRTVAKLMLMAKD